MKVVFDTNVLISATMWDNSVSHKLLVKLIQRNDEIISCIEVLEEYQRVLARDFRYEKTEINVILEKVMGFLKLVRPKSTPIIIKEDVSDNIILACALASDSKVILSYDKHLLNLKKYSGITIMTPDDFLKKRL